MIEVSAVTILTAWLAVTACFGIVFLLGKVYSADIGRKLGLAMWYVLTLIALLFSWIVAQQGNDGLAAMALGMTLVIDFFFIIIGRVYRVSVRENVIFILIAVVVFGIPMGRAWLTGDMGRIMPEAEFLLSVLVVIFAIVSVVVAIRRIKASRDARRDS